jgi:hypothetical protein
MAGAANYMYEKASVKGVGYKNVEMIISTQTGFNGQKLVEKESGSGNVITEKTELEAERQLNRDYTPIGSKLIPGTPAVPQYWVVKTAYNDPNQDGLIDGMNEAMNGQAKDHPIGEKAFVLPNEGVLVYYNYVAGEPATDPHTVVTCAWPTGIACPMDYINFTKEAEFEYMPISYQTGTYDQKWVEKLCVQNYRIGAVLTEMYTHAEHLQKTTEVKTRGYGNYGIGSSSSCPACCTGVLEANLNSNIIGVAHIGWISRDPFADSQLKGRHAEYGRSVEDLTGVFSIEKFIQLWGNSTCGAISVDWLPCV